MSDWVSVSFSAQLSIVDPHKGKVGHTFASPKRMAWLTYCARCGHVAHRNYISTLVTKIGCNYEHDQRYQAWVRGGKKAA